MEVLSKDIIDRWITPHLSHRRRGPEPGVPTADLVRAIFHRLKTGTQWRFLPLAAFFEPGAITWSGIYHHHRKWIRDGSWRRAWVAMLRAGRRRLDLSCMQLDGSQTLVKKQAEGVGCQKRKAALTTNTLFLVDAGGQPLAMATPQAGNHNDLYQIQALFEEMCGLLQDAGLDLKGVFLNADAGFDSEALRQICSEKQIELNAGVNKRNQRVLSDAYVYFDEELYKKRFVIERTNAWLDGFKTLLVRYEGKINTWMAAHFMAFIILLLKQQANC